MGVPTRYRPGASSGSCDVPSPSWAAALSARRPRLQCALTCGTCGRGAKCRREVKGLITKQRIVRNCGKRIGSTVLVHSTQHGNAAAAGLPPPTGLISFRRLAHHPICPLSGSPSSAEAPALSTHPSLLGFGGACLSTQPRARCSANCVMLSRAARSWGALRSGLQRGFRWVWKGGGEGCPSGCSERLHDLDWVCNAGGGDPRAASTHARCGCGMCAPAPPARCTARHPPRPAPPAAPQ